MKSAIEWLTQESQPAVRYLAMRDLLGASPGDLKAAEKAIPSNGWVRDILRKRLPGGFWVNGENLYRPKYYSTNWMLLTLSDLGVTRELPWVAESAEMWRDRYARPDGVSTWETPRRASSASRGTPRGHWSSSGTPTTRLSGAPSSGW